MKKKILIVVLIGLMIVGLIGCSQDPEKVILASVEEETITLAKLDQYLAIYSNANTGASTDKEAKSGILKEIVDMEIITQYMKKNGIEIDEETQTQYEAYIEQIRADENATQYMEDNGIEEQTLQELFYSQYYMMKLSEEITEAIGDLDLATEKYYEEHQEEYLVDEVKASHILVTKEEEAKEILAKIEAGEDFAELAKEHSIDGSAANGGDLGYFVQEKMVVPFGLAAFALEPGETSDIVQSQFGYHIIKSFDKRTRQIELEEIYEDIVSILYEEKFVEKLENMRSELEVKEYFDRLK
ncbi:MAG: peptidylprolyl isomerase [Peptostreptococcales bacterium]